MPKIGRDNPCKACLAEGRASAFAKGQGKKESALRGTGYVHGKRPACMMWAGFVPYNQRGGNEENEDPAPKTKCMKVKAASCIVTPTCVTIQQVKDSRMCCEDELMVSEEAHAVNYSRCHPAPALFAGAADQYLLEYKVFGLFKVQEEEEAIMDTHWLSIKDLLEAGVAAAEVTKMVTQYEQKYLTVSRAHWAATQGPSGA